MKKILLFILLISTAVFSQYKRENKIVIRGDDQKLYFNYNEDLRSDTLTFVVKADTSISSPRLIQKISTNTAELKTRYLANQTYITIVLQSYDTGDLNAGRYWYDIKRKHNDDTTTIFMGWFDLWSAVGTPFDGTALPGGTRFYTAGAFIDSTTQDSSLFMWDEATQSIVTVPYQSYIGAITDTILSGTATIPAGNNSVVVTHGLGQTPSISNMNVWCYDWSRGNEFKIVNINSITFTILLDSTIALDTVTYDLHYSWQVFNVDLSLMAASKEISLSDYVDISSAVDAIGNYEKTLLVDKDESISISDTIPKNIVLKFINGSILTCSDTIKIEGYIEAGNYQIFSDQSKVDLSECLNSKVLPQWFGAKSDSTDKLITGNAFQSAINSIGSSGKTLFIPNGVYAISSGNYYAIQFGDNTNWEGESQDKTILCFPDNYVAIGQEAGYASVYNNNNVKMKNFTIKGDVAKINTHTVQSGIYIYWRTPDPMFKNVEISNITAEDFNSGAITVSNAYNVLVENNRTNNTGYYGSASITVTGVKCRVLNNKIDKSLVGMELLASAYPTTLDTNYSFIVKGNLIEAQSIGLSINQSDFADIQDNHIYWVNITGKNDTTMYISSVYNPSVALSIWISHFKDLNISRNSFSGFTNHIQFTQSQKAYYDTTIYIGNTTIKDNYFSKSGERMITWNKTFYCRTRKIDISDNKFYYWYYKQSDGGVARTAVDLRLLDNVTIDRNTFWSEASRSRNPMTLVNMDTLTVSNNIYPKPFLITGTNTELKVFNNSLTENYDFEYYDYVAPDYLEKHQEFGVYEGGISVSGAVNTDSLFVGGLKVTPITILDNELVTNGTFTSNTSGWSGQSSTIKHYNSDWNSIGRTNVLLDSATNTVNVATYFTIDTLELNKQYEISFDYYIPSGNTSVTAVIPSLVKNFVPSAQTFYTARGGTNAWTTITFTVTADALYNQIFFYQGQMSGAKTSTAGDKTYIDNVTIKKILQGQETIDAMLSGKGFSVPTDSSGLSSGRIMNINGQLRVKY